MIGTVFDFFASQNLAHLRNEEVYKSPNFLQDFQLNSSLEIEPEDRCFHIFLKMVALGVKHFGEVNNEKGLRNLVARLLPNHDRQYPKEDAVHQRDLASLRNHHDLLCTLFLAAPPQHRPAASKIQALVNPSRSHTEACIINIQSWKHLARFVLATDPTYESYHSLADWQHALLGDLLTQLENTSTDVRAQAAEFSGMITESQILDTIIANTVENERVLAATLQGIKDSLKGSPNSTLSILVLRQHIEIGTYYSHL